MPDRRFFEHAGPISLADLSALCGVACDPAHGVLPIETAAPLVHADGRSVSFFSDRRYLADLKSTAAAAVFLPEGFREFAPEGVAVLITSSPQAAWSIAAARLHPIVRFQPGPAIHPDSDIEAGAVLAPGVVVAAGARIGAGTFIGPNSTVGPGVSIGRNCEIGANVTIGFALIGDGVRIASGVVIGEPGFGVAAGAKGAMDVPQLGRVILQDGVSIGANSSVDRGAWSDTILGENTKIDNLVQIAHNVVLGRNCAVAAHVGISGSAVIGDGVQFGGQAGVAPHIKIGDGASIAGQAGVMRDLGPGETVAGFPALPIRQWLREAAWLSKQATSRDKD